VLAAKNEVFETYLNRGIPSLGEGFLLRVHIKTTKLEVEMKKDFAESERYHSLRYPDVYEIRRNGYRCNVCGPQKYAQGLLPKETGSNL
jgi:hypothetical protein